MKQIATINTLNLFETTKQERTDLVKSVIKNIAEGNKGILETHLQIRYMRSMIEELESDPEYKKYLLEEVSKYGKVLETSTAVLSVKEAGVKYNYSACNDLEYNELIKQKEALDTQIKTKEKYLKAIKKPITILIEETGEVSTIEPPVKTSTTIVATELK